MNDVMKNLIYREIENFSELRVYEVLNIRNALGSEKKFAMTPVVISRHIFVSYVF